MRLGVGLQITLKTSLKSNQWRLKIREKNGDNSKGNERVMQFILMTAKDILAAL